MFMLHTMECAETSITCMSWSAKTCPELYKGPTGTADMMYLLVHVCSEGEEAARVVVVF